MIRALLLAALTVASLRMWVRRPRTAGLDDRRGDYR